MRDRAAIAPWRRPPRRDLVVWFFDRFFFVLSILGALCEAFAIGAGIYVVAHGEPGGLIALSLGIVFLPVNVVFARVLWDDIREGY